MNYIKLTEKNVPKWNKQGNIHRFEISLINSLDKPTGVLYELARIKKTRSGYELKVKAKAQYFSEAFWNCEKEMRILLPDLKVAKKIAESFLK